MARGPLPRTAVDRLSGRARLSVIAAVAIVIAIVGVISTVANASPAAATNTAFRRHRTTTTTALAATTSTAPAATTTTLPSGTSTTTVVPATTVPANTTTTTASRVTTTTTPPPATTSTTVQGAGGTSGSVLFGAATAAFSDLSTFDADAGKNVSLYLQYYSFAQSSDFDTSTANAIVKQGATPYFTWEPWDPSNGSANQPAYSLQKIASGAYDSYITRWATEIKAWGQPLWLRFAHEMNGNWYPWGDGVNGNTPAEYVAAYRHVHDLFAQVGVTNVSWLWTPNVDAPGWTPISQFYPGDGYVDYVGADGYNWGTTQSWGSTWQTPTQVFGQTLGELSQLTAKPIVIGETASAEQGGNKAQWIQQYFSMLSSTPNIKAFVWFNLNKETDWRIQSSSAAMSAFATGIANSRYRAG